MRGRSTARFEARGIRALGTLSALTGAIPPAAQSTTRRVVSTPTPWPSLAAMVYDSLRGVTVMFGGHEGNPYLGNTRAWNGSTWAQLATSGPSARASHAMAYDPVRGVTVLFGGE